MKTTALLVLALVATTTPSLAQTMTLGVGPNLVAVPAGSTVSDAAGLAELYGRPFAARTIIAPDGRTRFEAYIPGLSTPFPINPNESRGYIVFGGARKAMPIPVFVTMGYFSVRYYSDTGENIAYARVSAEPGDVPLTTDGKSIFASRVTTDRMIIHRYSIKSGERTTFATLYYSYPNIVINDFRIQHDGSLTYKAKWRWYQPEYYQITPNGELRNLFQEPSQRAFSEIRSPVIQGQYLYLLRQFTDSTQPIDGIYYHMPQVWRINLSSSGLERFLRLTNEPAGVHWLDVSWDGKQMVYVPSIQGNDNIWIKETSGARYAELLVSDPAHDYLPRFFPDGRRVLFHSNRGEEGELYTVSLENIQDVRRFGTLIQPSYDSNDRFLLLTREELP